jgi:hypothetical protein
MLTGQQQLESILTAGTDVDVGRELSDMFSTALIPTVFAPIERKFEDVLGLDEFGLQMGYHEPIQLTIGERLLGSFYLSYTASLGVGLGTDYTSDPYTDYSNNPDDVKLTYRLKSGLEMGVQMDQNSMITGIVEGRLQF